VADLRAWVAAARDLAGQEPGLAAGPGGAGIGGVGLVAARRALRLEGTPGPTADPILVEIVPPSNIAVGTVPWGLGRWVRPGSVQRITTSVGAGEAVPDLGAVVAAAASRPLLIVVRDAHRYPAARSVVSALVAARPDAVVIEMGLPVWRPHARAYLATFGATHASSLAAAELLRLTQEVSARGPDRP
jgi:beta-N-acetylhexosaminidase